jgi:hypothetical protein
MGEVFSYFASTHGELFADQFGVDLSTIDYQQAMEAQLSAQPGIDASDGVSFREVSEVQAQRMDDLRRARG